MVRKSYNSGSYVAYTYNAEGSLARLSYGDSTGELASYRFEYDSLGRLIRSAELDADGGTVQRTEHIYDGYNRLSRQSWTLGGKTYSESYVYDDPSDTNKNGDGALTRMTTATGATIDYQYDTLRRLTRSEVTLNGLTVYTTAYAFRDLDASRTTTQVQYRNVRNANGEVLEGKKYTYDALGNITRISQSTGHFYPLVAYEYDAQNQLTKETYYNGNGTSTGNITRTISYTYDTAGNILSETRTEDGETTTKTYGYGDSEWVDLLTEVDGQAITYDASGNPTSYFGRTMTWTNGRQLKTSTTHAFGAVLKSTYTYDADGIRKTKTIPINQRGLTCTYTFVTQNGKVVRQSWRTESIDFFYDESGRPFAMTYQRANDAPQTYYYVLNLQGDVVKLIDENGAEVASYEYDAWGNVLSQSGSMASTNPLRYRGYYHDSETGFYYLQSRYYDPAMHRFINADSYASTGQGFIGTNMFAYCHNSPVAFYDTEGNMATEATIAATNWWNPIGWIAGGILVVEVVVAAVVISEEIDSESAIKSHEISEKQANGEPTPTVSSSKKEKEKPKTPDVTYPGDDPSQAPDGYEWRGKDEPGGKRGGYANKNGTDSWHPDLDHPDGVEPHWDYNNGHGNKWRVYPDGRIDLVK